ncbi:Oidioi.mRNA.OKI2018_I69.XSR.g14444.t1.cds [Oikopleura dioica]|uniref:Oidioi.mRNA.OKI2018_I69.XSR.g14444.t1.cds n=1 Tax=Oikopleura dioica TaxID=34765 RepID=A0ABN7S9S5_OIKDI|nr:Oidioi.mRNA.OKI2018_I69.XSR.g14444.t1.cds [Oikopleura dioica]
MFIPSKNIESFSGKLILAVPSEGCIGQRAVDSILSDEGNNFEFYGSFDATSIQPMVGRVENGRVVTCMELFFSPTTEIGLVQLRAPPLSNSSFCAEFIPWFRASGFEKLILLAGVQCSFPLPQVVVVSPEDHENVQYITEDFLNSSIRRAGFSKKMVAQLNSVDLIMSPNIADLSHILRTCSSLYKVKCADALSLEKLSVQDSVY